VTTALDTNVLSALWNDDDALNRAAAAALHEIQRQDRIVICAVVYAELMAAAARTEVFIDRFCEETGIAVEWELKERVWRTAGAAFQAYAQRRRKLGASEPRRLLADFVIGAHAQEGGYRLLSADPAVYKRAFPGLSVEAM
jgi:predicted nucleic acid-binding protein